MSPRTRYRFRYALRLVASVFLLSTPCGGSERAVRSGAVAQVLPVTETNAIPRTFAAAYRPVR